MRITNLTDLTSFVGQRTVELIMSGDETNVSRAARRAWDEVCAAHEIDGRTMVEDKVIGDATKTTRKEVGKFVDPDVDDEEPPMDMLPGFDLPPISPLVRIDDDEYKRGADATAVEHAMHGEHHKHQHQRRARRWAEYERQHNRLADRIEDDGYDPLTITIAEYEAKLKAEAGDIDDDDDVDDAEA